MPAGFSAVNTNDAKWNFDSANNKVTDYNKGLVIMDSKGNQFVWVPVDNTTISYKYHYINAMYMFIDLPKGITNEQDQITKYKGFYVGRYEAGIDIDIGSDALKRQWCKRR